MNIKHLFFCMLLIAFSSCSKPGYEKGMAKAISAELSVEVAEAILYADDGADEVVKEFVSGEIINSLYFFFAATMSISQPFVLTKTCNGIFINTTRCV